MVRAVLLDVGGVLIKTPFELLDVAERRHGLPDGALGPRGPFDIDADPAFRAVLAGDLTERTYWRQRAERAAPLLGTGSDTRSLMRVLFDLPEEEVVRPEVGALVRDARAAGRRVGALTNDLVGFHGDEWVERIAVFGELDVTVDGSVTGVLKPDPRAYELAVTSLGEPADRVLFLDDQPVNLRGAAAVGLEVVQVDVTDPRAAIEQARRRLCLD